MTGSPPPRHAPAVAGVQRVRSTVGLGARAVARRLAPRWGPDDDQRWANWAAAPGRPTFSVLLPTFESDPKWLQEAVESVKKQVYPHWQLCIADDASTSTAVHDMLDDLARDPRVTIVRRLQNGHISKASNDALSLATGDYVVLLDHDDALAPLALLLCATAVVRDPGLRLLFTDEDKVDEEGRRSAPYRKRPLDRDLLLSHNAISHLGVVSTHLVREVGGFREGLEGSQDHDLVLRCLERLDDSQVRHLPFVLYHWRTTPQSTAGGGEAKPYAVDAGRRAIREHLGRQGHSVDVTYVSDMGYRVTPSAALITEDPIVAVEVPLGASGADLNRAVRACSAAEVVLLAQGTCLTSETWQQELRLRLHRPGVGAVGGRVADTLGRTVDGALGVSGRPWVGLGRPLYASAGTVPFAVDRLEQSVSALSSAFLAIRRDIFEQIGGFDDTLGAAADVDLCLKLHQAGLRCSYLPWIVASPGAGPVRRSWPDSLRVRARWRPPARDPRYPAAFRYRRLGWRPRVWEDDSGVQWLRSHEARGKD